MAGSEGTLTGKVLGSYQIGELIGAGQLAEVYQAKHPGLPQTVALKVFAPSVAANAAYASGMRDIAGRASLLTARHILPIHGFAQEGKTLYLSMPLMRESLRTILLRSSRLPIYHAMPLLGQIAYGLASAHTVGILHLDLKPENVLLDAEGQAFVSDFGVGRTLPSAEAERRSLGTLTSLIGTPAYMAPEQLRGQPTDQRADVYALGIIFYEMLTGDPPYNGATIYEVASQVLTTPVPPPSRRASGITPSLERAILRALASDPAERWPTVQQFIVGLNAALPTRTDGAIEEQSSTQNSLWQELTTGPLSAPNEVAPDAAEQALDVADDATQPLAGAAPTIANEATIEDAPTLALFAHTDLPPNDDIYGNTSAIATPDLRLFRVDPLPPMEPRRQHTGLLLAGVAFLLLVILGGGGVLLTNAAQSSRTKAIASPTSPPATQLPTHTPARPTVTPKPTVTATAVPFVPPPPLPTATTQPTATVTPKPTATTIPQPTATPVPPQPTATTP